MDEGFRGKGIGKVLMEKAEQEARARGCTVGLSPVIVIISEQV